MQVKHGKRMANPSWQAMRKLLSKGLELDAGQTQKYNRLWSEHLTGQFRYLLPGPKVREHMKGSGQTAEVTMLFEFKAGQPYPKTYLAKSCGDTLIDRLVVLALRRVRMDDPILVPSGKDIPDILAPILLGPFTD
jgi:hypothetical protein